MSLHGVFVPVGTTEETTFTSKTGLSMVTAALMTPFRMNEAPIGYVKLLSYVATAAAGNMVAVNSISGGFGVSALGRTVKFA